MCNPPVPGIWIILGHGKTHQSNQRSARRQSNGLKKLAAKLGKNPNTVTSLCNNKSQPHLMDLKRIAEILDVDIRELLVPTKEY